MCAVRVQEEAVRNLKKPRPEQDTSKAPEYERALVDLAQAHRIFNHLIALGTHRTGIDKKKLSQHLEFCTVTHTKAAQLLEVVRFVNRDLLPFAGYFSPSDSYLHIRIVNLH